MIISSHFIIFMVDMEMIELLIDYGADVTLKVYDILLPHYLLLNHLIFQDYANKTPLKYACQTSNILIVHLLLDHKGI